jgi:aminoglycoside phosphotransferase (APT) family kinase protein
VRFYRELRDALPVRAPRVLAARWREPGARFALVLEDLSLGGARFRDILAPCTPPEARAVVAELARLHAALWRSPRFEGDLAWLRAPGRHPFAKLERAVRERLVASGARAQAARLPAPQRAAAAALSRHYRALEDFWAVAPRALLHGDPHLGNLFFAEAGPGLLDWQVVQIGDPLRDLAYFLVLSLAPPARREEQRELVRVYSEALAGAGVDEMDFETAWRRYRGNALYPWVSALATAGAPRLQGGEIQREGVRRSAAAFEDLDPLAVLGSA